MATGDRAGQRVRRRLIDPEEGVSSGPLCFFSRGFSLHAATCVEASDRARLERLCQYVIRPPPPAQRRHRLAWAVLLARVWAIDVTECPACGGRMKVVAAVTDPCSIRRYLEGVGLPARAPPIAPARPQRQQELDLQFAAAQT